VDLAAQQLATAVALFLGGHDRFSVITLAAAADGILAQLVSNSGQQNFIEASLKDQDHQNLTRGELGKRVNDILLINKLKHMDKGEEEYVLIDVDGCAIATILKAFANFVKLDGRDVPFIKDFLQWVKENLDPTKYNINCDPNWKPMTVPSPPDVRAD
jgi:hypothetical protein